MTCWAICRGAGIHGAGILVYWGGRAGCRYRIRTCCAGLKSIYFAGLSKKSVQINLADSTAHCFDWRRNSDCSDLPKIFNFFPISNQIWLSHRIWRDLKVPVDMMELVCLVETELSTFSGNILITKKTFPEILFDKLLSVAIKIPFVGQDPPDGHETCCPNPGGGGGGQPP